MMEDGGAMSALLNTRAGEKLASQKPVDFRGFTTDEIVPYLVGHTVKEIECELILHTLIHHCGNRTHSARVLGISIRSMRNKLHEYEELGIAVPAHEQRSVGHL